MVFPFSFFFHFRNNFSLPITLLFIIIREKLKRLIVNVNKQKDALKKSGITVDGVHYAVRCKGKFHIIINKIFFSTIIFNPNACMYIDHSFQKFISTVILDLKALYFLLEQIGKANLKLGKRGTEVECCFICKALRVCGYIQNL